jgi:Uma2 family endonuclease
MTRQTVDMNLGHVQALSVPSNAETPATCIILEEQLEIPLGLKSLEDFRRWAVSDDFPESGRIDYIGGRIEVDMSPEDLFAHGKLKGELARLLLNRVDADDRGHLFIDRARISVPAADLSAEPDIVFLSHSAVEDGRIRLVPKANKREGRFIEVEGPPDLVVEIVSDSTVKKDTLRLPAAYWKAGVQEFWLADARSDEELVFIIHYRGELAFQAVAVDQEGYQRSEVMGCRYRLDRSKSHGQWRYRLSEQELT